MRRKPSEQSSRKSTTTTPTANNIDSVVSVESVQTNDAKTTNTDDECGVIDDDEEQAECLLFEAQSTIMRENTMWVCCVLVEISAVNTL